MNGIEKRIGLMGDIRFYLVVCLMMGVIGWMMLLSGCASSKFDRSMMFVFPLMGGGLVRSFVRSFGPVMCGYPTALLDGRSIALQLVSTWKNYEQ